MGSYSANFFDVSVWSEATVIGQNQQHVMGKITDSAIPSTEIPTKVAVSGSCIIAKDNNTGTGAYEIRLCDVYGGNTIVLKSGTAALNGGQGTTLGGTECAPFTANVTGGSVLKGKTVMLSIASTGGTFLRWRGNMTVTLTTGSAEYTITVTSQTGGSCTANKSKAAAGTTITLTPTANTGYSYAGFTMNGTAKTGTTFTMPSANATVVAKFTKNSYTITVSSQTGGSCTANKSSAGYGDTVTLTPTASTGYTYNGFTLNGTAKTGTTFSMPAANATVVAKFTKNSYAITLASSPTGAGSVTANKSTAGCGDSVTVSQTPATGYYFNGWTSSPSVTINSSGVFTMPAQEVKVTANYLKRSTGSLNKTSMAGGSTVTLTISADKTTYTHKYKLSFGSGMETSLTNVAAGVTSVTISVPLNWSASIPSATSKTGGTLTLETYSGSTKIGTYTITGLTYTVPASVVPTLTNITTSIARTIGGTTYANVGDYYVQNHSGVRIQTTAAGAQSSTIASVVMSMSGYSGTNYKKTQSAAALDFTSGLLSIAGSTTITVTATDSRGRTATKTATITVTAYQKPGGTLSVWRVDTGHDADDFGEWGQYSLTTTFSQIGSNAITTVLSCNSQSSTNPAASGDLLPETRLALSIQNEYEVTLTVTDAFETTTIKAKIRSGKYVMYVDPAGEKIGFMKVANKAIPSGKESTFEIAATSQVYIGDYTLEDYIRLIANS